MHQDAHEFLNYTLNTIAEDVQKYQQRIVAEEGEGKDSIHSESSSHGNGTDATSTGKKGSGRSEKSKPYVNKVTPFFIIAHNPKTTWVHQLFEGVFSNETKCLSCETVSA